MIILYRYNNDIWVQRMDHNSIPQWGVNGRAIDNDGATTITSEEQIVFIPGAVPGDDEIIIVANNGTDDIVAWRIDNTVTPVWGPVAITNLSGSIQRNPQIFYNGNDTIITWDDNRFASLIGWGVFGSMILADVNGSADPAWSASASGAPDYNGIAFVLNNYSEFTSDCRVVPYNNGSEAVLIWTDYRTQGNLSDMLFCDLGSFAP
jgi:hypothetical protein